MARKNNAPRRSTSRGVRQNMMTERAAGRDEVIIVSSRRRLRSSLIQGCIAALRRQRPGLPVQRVEGGKVLDGIKVHVDDDTRTMWIECTSVKHWTRNLDLAAFPAGVQVAAFGPNVIGVFAPVDA